MRLIYIIILINAWSIITFIETPKLGQIKVKIVKLYGLNQYIYISFIYTICL